MNKKRILMGLGAFAFLGLTTVLTSCGGEKTYTVKFLDGQTELSSSTVTSGYNVEVPTAPTSDGKIFNGWYADEALTKPFDFGSIIEGDTNVYAAWVNEFTVTFKDGSKILSTTTVTSGYNVKAPANPTAKSGKTFAGWFADAALTKPFNFGSVITSATTVYAKWDSVYHNVNLYIDGNTLWKTVAIEEGETLSYEGAPTKDYREFANKWYTDAACTNLFNTATAVEEEFNLYAGWTAKMDVAESKFDFDAFQNYCGGSGKTSTSEFTDGKFTIDAGMRVDSGPLLNTQGKNIVFETIGNGTLSFKVSSKSSGNPLILSIYKLPLGTDVSTTDFTKETAVYDKETPNGQTLDGSFAVEKGYRYVIKTVKSAGYTALSLSENVEVSAPEKIEVASKKNQFIAGTELDLSLNVTEKFVNTSTQAVMPKDGDKKGYTVDTSKVDMTKAGTYKVTVNFTDSDDYGTYPMSAEFEVEVFDLKEIVLGFNATEKLSTNTKAGNGVYYNNKVAQVLGLNDELDLSALTIKAVSTEEGFFELYKNKQAFEAENSSLTVSSIDTSTAGEKEVTVKLTLNGVEKTATFKVNVVNTEPAYDKVNNIVKTYVDPTYTGVIGAVENGANTFNTIQQALDYLVLQDKYDNVRKEIKLAEGTYNEKLEIEIPNLTIVGADNLADSSKYVISWNSLYGVADESGFAQQTDSTQTVAVRETAENCLISGITIQNVYNTIDSYDDVYPGNGERGLALLLQADKFIMENGRLLGWQDTLETFTGRQVFNNCFIQGCVDYIFGTNSTTVFNGCEIHTVKSKASSKEDAAAAYVTAYKGNNKDANDAVQYGAIFNACNFTVADDFVGYVCIGRSWAAYAAVTVIDSTFSDKFATTADKLIHEGLSVKNETSTLKYFFYDNKKEDGTDFVVEEDITDVTHTLSQEQITALHLDNVKETLDELFKLENGKVTYSDYWNPVAPTTTITIYDDKDKVLAIYDINAYIGKKLTSAQIASIKELIKSNLDPDTQILDGIFTDKSYDTDAAFDKNVTLTASVAVYAKIKNATITRTIELFDSKDYTTSPDSITAGTTLFDGTNFKVDLIGVNASIATDKSPAVAEKLDYETEAKTFTKAVLPSGGTKFADGKGYKITAKADGTIRFYFTASNSSFTTTDQSKKDTLVVKTGDADPVTLTEVNYSNKIAYLYEIDAKKDIVYQIGSTANRLVLFGVEYYKQTVEFEEDDTVVDQIIAYQFDGKTTTGATSSYSWSTAAEGTSATLGDLSIDATSGKFAYNTSGYTQINAGTKLSFVATGYGTMTVTNFSGQHAYKIKSGDAEAVAATADSTTINVTKGTTYVIEATDTAYLYNIVISYPASLNQVFKEETVYAYQFDGKTTAGAAKSYSWSTAVEGDSTKLGDLSIDATSGKFAYNTSGYTQINAGTKLSFVAAGNGTMTVTNFSGQHAYKIKSGDAEAVAATADSTTVNITRGTTYVIEATDTAYLYNIILTYAKDATPASQVEAHNYALDLTKITSTTDKQKLTADILGNSFLTVVDSNKVTARYKNSANYCIENVGDSLSVTFNGTGTISIAFASTGGAGTNNTEANKESYVGNVSTLGLKDADGHYLEASNVGSGATLIVSGASFDDCKQEKDANNKDIKVTVQKTWAESEAGAYYVSGTTYVTVTYTITTPGTYIISCPNTSTSRGARINAITMVDNF